MSLLKRLLLGYIYLSIFLTKAALNPKPLSAADFWRFGSVNAEIASGLRLCNFGALSLLWVGFRGCTLFRTSQKLSTTAQPHHPPKKGPIHISTANRGPPICGFVCFLFPTWEQPSMDQHQCRGKLLKKLQDHWSI